EGDAGHGRRPGGGGDQRAERPHGGRLPGAVWAEEAEDLAVGDLKRDVLERNPVTEALAEAPDRESRRAARRVGWCAGHRLDDGNGACRSRHDAVDLEEEVARAAQERVGPVGRRVLYQARVDEAASEFGERDLCLHAGQWGAVAVVDAAAEPQMLVVGAV